MTVPQRLLRVVPVALTGAFASWLATLDNDDYCGTVGECLGLAFDDVLVPVVVLPAGALLLRLLRVPRAVLHALAALAAGVALWYAASELLSALDPGRAYDAVVPWPLAVVVGVLAGAAATYVVGPGRPSRRDRLARAATPLAVVALTVAAGTAAAATERADRIEEIAAAPVTHYQPEIRGVRGDGYATEQGVRLSYLVESAPGQTYLVVELVPSRPGTDLCEQLQPVPTPDCESDGTTMREGAEDYAGIAVVRGDTVLHAQGVDTTEVAAEEVLEALRTAPVVDATALAG
jgi:hypothetical protein